MKKTIGLTFTLLFMIAFALTQASLASQEGEMTKKKSDKPAKAAPAPKTDAEIQKCVSDKLATYKNLTNAAATVTNGEVTLTGDAKTSAAKGSAARAAKACGGKKVTNNITAPAPPAAAKAADKKKTEPEKKQ